MNPINVRIFPLSRGWGGITTFDNGSTEEKQFASFANAQWYFENMMGRMKNAV